VSRLKNMNELLKNGTNPIDFEKFSGPEQLYAMLDSMTEPLWQTTEKLELCPHEAILYGYMAAIIDAYAIGTHPKWRKAINKKLVEAIDEFLEVLERVPPSIRRMGEDLACGEERPRVFSGTVLEESTLPVDYPPPYGDNERDFGKLPPEAGRNHRGQGFPPFPSR
jgi:hypothetical protein